MEKIIIGETAIEVLSLSAYTYDYGRGEKVLRIEVDETAASFEELKAVLNGNEEPIQYFEDDALKCEYVGYTEFECQYANGVFKIEIKKGALVDQVNALLTANERLNMALSALDEANGKASATIAMLEEQNAMLEACILEISEIVYA